jgi:protein-tyrosine phosphatase
MPDRVSANLWMGSAPDCGANVREGWDVLVLCAMEHQLPSNCFRGVKVLHVPLDDGRFVPANEILLARKAATVVARCLRDGQRILVTCYLGRNRSGLVCALALTRLGASADTAIATVRAARGSEALSNPAFVQLIRQPWPTSRP